jgi:FixJ family two-component response regulator
MAGFQTQVAIVDDDESVRKALCRLLRASDLDAHSYASGQEFLDSLEERRFDCLVLDLQMPGMTGLEVQEHLARSGSKLPVVIITAHDEPGSQKRCLDAGAAAYLCKPLKDRILLGAIASAISVFRPAG